MRGDVSTECTDVKRTVRKYYLKNTMAINSTVLSNFKRINNMYCIETLPLNLKERNIS